MIGGDGLSEEKKRAMVALRRTGSFHKKSILYHNIQISTLLILR